MRAILIETTALSKSFVLSYMCMHIYVHMCAFVHQVNMCVCLCVCVNAWRGQKSTLASLSISLHLNFDQGLSLNMALPRSTRLDGQ